MQEFDYVFDIELDEGGPTMRKLKLPYNKDSKISGYGNDKITYCALMMYLVCFCYSIKFS